MLRMQRELVRQDADSVKLEQKKLSERSKQIRRTLSLVLIWLGSS